MKRWISLPKVILLLLALGAGIALGVYKNHQTKLQEVTINFPQGVKVSIYNDSGGDGAFNYNPNQKPLFTLESSQKIQTERGVYDFVIDNSNNDYDNPVTKQPIDYGTTEVILKPVYTETKLASLLPTIKPAALGGLYAAYPLIQQNYTISKDGLYGVGDWYGAVIAPKNPAMDTLRVILHKEGSSWKMAIKEPVISIGKPSNSNIPPAVIEQVDEL
jgi:hypothetical protein